MLEYAALVASPRALPDGLILVFQHPVNEKRYRMEKRGRAGFLGYEAVSQNGTSLEEQEERKGERKMNYAQMTAPCGLDCFNCPLYLAGENLELRSVISKKMNIPSDGAFCKGCRNENGTIPILNMTGPCRVYQCVQQKNIDFCSDCTDFPCDHLHPYADKAGGVPHNTKVFNLCLIKKMGLEAWAQNKAKSVKNTYFKGKWKI